MPAALVRYDARLTEQIAKPADYSKLPPALPSKVPELGPPLPGDRRPAIVKSQQPVTGAYAPPAITPTTRCARKPNRPRHRPCSSARARRRPPRWRNRRPPPHRALPPMRPSTRWPPGRPRRRPSLPTRPPCRTGKTRRRRFRKPEPRKPVIPAIWPCRLHRISSWPVRSSPGRW